MNLRLAVSNTVMMMMWWVAYYMVPTHGQSTGCSISPDYHWVNQGVNASIHCMTSNPKWWIASDPCQADGAAEFMGCSGGGNTCTVLSETYNSMESCVVCCTESSVSVFTPSVVTSCGKIGVCPQVSYAYPTIATAGSTIEFFTFVSTKPRPPTMNVSVSVRYYQKDPVVASQKEEIFLIPGSTHNYTFVHIIHIPSDVVSVAFIQVDLSGLPRGTLCSFGDSAVLDLEVLQVDGSETTAPTTPSSSSSGLSPHTDSFQLDSLSLGIGVGITIAFGIVFLIIAVPMLIIYKRKHSRKKSKILTGGNRHLLTINNTPTTTPSSESQHTLGHQISETPASTPTEIHALLNNGTADDHYQQISPLNGRTQSRNSPFQSTTTQIVMNQKPAVLTPPMGSGAPPPPPSPPPQQQQYPPPQHPPPTYVPSPPKGLHSESRPSTLQPSLLPRDKQPLDYATHGEAMHLTQEYNKGDEHI